MLLSRLMKISLCIVLFVYVVCVKEKEIQCLYILYFTQEKDCLWLGILWGRGHCQSTVDKLICLGFQKDGFEVLLLS